MVDSLRRWLLAFLSRQEQQAMCRLWMFKGGFELAAAQRMLVRSDRRLFAEVKVALRGLTDASCLQLSTPSAAGTCAARYSMHPLVAEIFRDEFGALSELQWRLVLQDFIQVLGGTTGTLEGLRGTGPDSPHAADDSAADDSAADDSKNGWR